MVEFPNFDVAWAMDRDSSHERMEWRRALAAHALTWLESSDEVTEWMAAFNHFRREILTAVWEASIPFSIRTQLQYVIFGSGGRSEDLLNSDLDHAVIVHGDASVDDYLSSLQKFVATMSDLGFPMCSGYVMSPNPRWRGTLADWMTRIDGYLGYPNWDHARYLYMVLDGTPLDGSSEEWTEIQTRVATAVRESPFICWEMAHLGIHRTVAINVFGQLRRKRGENQGLFHVKDGFLNPMVHAIRLLAVANGCKPLKTLGRVHCLQTSGALSDPLAHQVAAALKFGWSVRLAAQASDILGERPISDFIDLDEMTAARQRELLQHMETAKQLERFIHRRFRKPR